MKVKDDILYYIKEEMEKRPFGVISIEWSEKGNYIQTVVSETKRFYNEPKKIKIVSKEFNNG
jgi:hypothetical protein